MGAKTNKTKILALCALAAFFLFRRQISAFFTVPEPRAAAPPPSGRQFVITGARLMRTGADGAVLLLHADRVEKGRGRLLRLSRIRARRRNRGGEVFMQAPAGTYDGAGILELSGGVEIRTADGYTARTAAARYDTRSRRLSGNSPVEMRGRGLLVRGEAFEFFPEKGLLRLEGRVRCRVEMGGLGA